MGLVELFVRQVRLVELFVSEWDWWSYFSASGTDGAIREQVGPMEFVVCAEILTERTRLI